MILIHTFQQARVISWNLKGNKVMTDKLVSDNVLPMPMNAAYFIFITLIFQKDTIYTLVYLWCPISTELWANFSYNLLYMSFLNSFKLGKILWGVYSPCLPCSYSHVCTSWTLKALISVQWLIRYINFSSFVFFNRRGIVNNCSSSSASSANGLVFKKIFKANVHIQFYIKSQQYFHICFADSWLITKHWWLFISIIVLIVFTNIPRPYRVGSVASVSASHTVRPS